MTRRTPPDLEHERRAGEHAAPSDLLRSDHPGRRPARHRHQLGLGLPPVRRVHANVGGGRGTRHHCSGADRDADVVRAMLPPHQCRQLLQSRGDLSGLRPRSRRDGRPSGRPSGARTTTAGAGKQPDRTGWTRSLVSKTNYTGGMTPPPNRHRLQAPGQPSGHEEVAGRLRIAINRLHRRLRQESLAGLSPAQASALGVGEPAGQPDPGRAGRDRAGAAADHDPDRGRPGRGRHGDPDHR